MPRFGPPRGGADTAAGRGRRPTLRLEPAPEHARERVPHYWPAARRERPARFVRRPARTVASVPATFTASIPLGGPSTAERARRLQAAYDASAHDEGQRQLLAEIMSHFRAWCEAHALGDPFRHA